MGQWLSKNVSCGEESDTNSQTPSVAESGAILRFGGGRYLCELS